MNGPGGAAGRLWFGLDTDNVAVGVYTNTAYNNNNWHHVVGVWTGADGVAVAPSQFRLYVNGALAATTAASIGTAPAAPLNGNGNTTIAYHQAWNAYWPGSIDEVVIHNVALSAGDVACLYSATAAKKSSWEFNTAGDVEGWYAKNEIAAGPTQSGGAMHYTTAAGASDPMVASPRMTFPRSQASWLRVRARNGAPATGAILFWNSNEIADFAGGYQANYPINPNDDQISEYWVNLSSVGTWNSAAYILELRFDFPDSGSSLTGPMVVDQISLLPSHPAVLPAATAITRYSPSGAGWTNATQVVWNVRFNHSMQTVAANDFSIAATGSAAGVIANVTRIGPTWYRVTADVSGTGTLRLDSVTGGSGRDVANQAIGAGYASGEVYSIDREGPAVAISAPSTSLTTNGPVTYTVTYTDAGSGFSASTLAVGNITLNTTGAATGTLGVSGSGNTRTVTISGITGDGTLGISIAAGTGTDVLGNTSPSAGPSAVFVVDNTGPIVTEVQVQSGLTVDVTFDEPMGAGVLTASNYAVSGAGQGTLANNPSNVALVSGNTYRLTWLAPNEMLDGGDITITVNNAQDVAGNTIGSPNSGVHTDGAIGVVPTAVCQNISRILPGPIVVNAIEIDGGSTDNVEITTRTINGGASQTYTSANVGSNSATLLVGDAAGNTNSCIATVTILKGDSTIIATGETSYTYSGNSQGPDTATVTGSTGVVAYSYSGTGATSYGPSSTKPTDAGAYQVVATVDEDANYNGATSAPLAFTILKATPTATLEVINSPVTYDGGAKAATVGVASSSTPGAAANILTGGAASQTNANTYAVTADFVPTDTANYNTLTGLAAGDFVIQKATPTATLEVTNSPVTYDGSAKAAAVGVASSSTPGAAANVLTGGAASQTNAGTYAVTADFVPSDTANYNTLTGLEAGDFVIDKATPTATLEVTNSPVTYNGAARAATVGVASSSTPGAAANVLTGGAASQTNAGTYAVTAEFVPTDTANYNSLTGLAAGDFVINKAVVTVTLVDVVKLWDDSTDVTLGAANFSVQGLVPGESLVISQTAGVFDSPDIGMDVPVSAGLIGFVTAGPGTDLNNYNLPDTANGLGTITDKFIPVVTWPSASAIVFGQALSASTLSGGSATDPFTSAPVDGEFAFDDETVVPPTAGSYNADVTFTPDDPATYASRHTQIPVEVQKATPVIITSPTASSIKLGQSLADSALTGGEASVDGDFAWTDGAIAPPLGVSEQSVTFMPEEDGNYVAVLLTISVTVLPAAEFQVLAVGGETSFIRAIGGKATFAVEAVNAVGTLSYQWYKLTEEKALVAVGADSPTYTIDPIGAEDFGEYQCHVFDAVLGETAESPVFTLIEGTGLTATALFGLALASALTALAGASVLRKKR